MYKYGRLTLLLTKIGKEFMKAIADVPDTGASSSVYLALEAGVPLFCTEPLNG